jgi:trehalose 6-phosphate synthase
MLRAIEMPLEERRQRHSALLERIRGRTIHEWARDFLNDLRQNSP